MMLIESTKSYIIIYQTPWTSRIRHSLVLIHLNRSFESKNLKNVSVCVHTQIAQRDVNRRELLEGIVNYTS